ncbi:hypothetical protein AAVH_10365, partial [Aphelenchoides avenae]
MPQREVMLIRTKKDIVSFNILNIYLGQCRETWHEVDVQISPIERKLYAQMEKVI